MKMELVVNVRPVERGIILDLKGDLTKQAEESLLQLRPWDQGLEQQKPFLVLNFTEVPYINSAGIATLIRLARTGIKANYYTFAYGLSSHFQKLFRMVGLTEYMAIYPNEYAALQRMEDLYQGKP